MSRTKFVFVQITILTTMVNNVSDVRHHFSGMLKQINVLHAVKLSNMIKSVILVSVHLIPHTYRMENVDLVMLLIFGIKN